MKLRQLLDNGDAQILGPITLNGQHVLEITGHSSDNMLFNGTIYVDATSYQPLLAEVHQNAYDCGQATPCSGTEQIPAAACDLHTRDRCHGTDR